MASAIFKKLESFLRNVHDDQIMRKVIQPTVHMIWLNPGILTVINKKQTSPTKINECMWMTLAPSDILPSLVHDTILSQYIFSCNLPLLRIIR